jgi:MFS family permease
MAATEEQRLGPAWLTRGVAGIGAASFFSDLGHEVPTSLLPSFLTSTLGAPAAALGIIEGVADGLAGVARLAGGALADDPERRRRVALGGYASTAVLSALIGVTTAAWQVGVLRAGAWTARGIRGPAKNALVADVVPSGAYGRAYGFERAMDNLGAVGGPLLALGLVALVGTRTAILLSVIPGLLAVLAIALAIRAAPRAERREHRPIRLRVRPVLRGRLGRLLLGMGAFEVGNVAATLLILRATELLEPGRGHDSAVKISLLLFAGYNVAASLASLPGGWAGDRHSAVLVLAAGVGFFAIAYAGLALAGSAIGFLIVLFVLAGIGIAFVETAENHAVASLAPAEIRGSAFGFLAAVQAFGNLAASAVAGILWTAISPRAAFLYLAGWMVVALCALGLSARSSRTST